jgi:hypothetical protein
MFSKEIYMLSHIRNNSDLIKIIKDEILSNKLVMKELKRSIIPKKVILDFFIEKELRKNISNISNTPNIIRKWFESIKRRKIYPPDIDSVTHILTVINAVVMDIYTIARMFKIFVVKKEEHYPTEAHNIIYYSGTGHTRPVAKFLNEIGFNRTEYSKDDILSCTNMENIKQPFFM